MIGAKLQGSTLTSKADYQNTTEWTYTRVGLLSSSWTQEDNYTISYRFGATIDVYPLVWKYTTFAPSTSPNYDLEWALVTYKSDNANVVATESAWYPVNTNINFASPVTSDGYTLRAKIYVRRTLDENGNRPQLSRSSINNCALMFVGNLYQTVEEQTLPADWFATTTQTNLFIPLVTVTTPIETYQGSHGGGGSHRDAVVHDLNYYLQIPQEVAGVVSYIFYLFGQIAQLKYVTTLICLAMVLGTLRFIMR